VRGSIAPKLAIIVGLGVLFQGCGSNSTPPPSVSDINGGLSGSGTVGSLFIVDGTSFGDLTSAAAGYSLDFRDATTNAVVASATSSVNFASGGWKSLFITGTVPSTLAGGSTYKVTVTTPYGTSNALSFLILSSASFSPSTILWSATASLPTAQQGFYTAVATIGAGATAVSYIYAIGGNTAANSATNAKASSSAAVYLNQLDGTSANAGQLVNATWTTASALPAPRGFAAAAVATSFNSKVGGNGTIYLLGGLDGTGAATGTVYEASLNADGSIPAAGAAGTWTATTAMPQALYAHGAVIFHGRIYIAGGNDSAGNPVASVISAPINADGSLGSWTSLPDLPAKIAYHQFLTAAGNLYVLGGTTSAVDPVSGSQSAGSQSAIYYNSINLKDGTLVNATWTTNGSGLSKSREKFTAVSAGGSILVTGGLYNGASTGASEQEYSSINTDGSISGFLGATGTHTISKTTGGYNFYNHSTAYFADATGNAHVLVIGGEDTNTGAPLAQAWYQH
jgi:N-acetylneuraminic acid mutarotase